LPLIHRGLYEESEELILLDPLTAREGSKLRDAAKTLLRAEMLSHVLFWRK
jgi:hypothetical protein